MNVVHRTRGMVLVTTDQLHRKKRVTYNLPDHAHFLTWSSYRRRQPGLHLLPLSELILASLRHGLHAYTFGLVAWVIMPEHIHLIVYLHQTDYSV